MYATERTVESTTTWRIRSRKPHSCNLLHNFANPLDRERVSRTALRRYVISRVSVNVARVTHGRESPRRNLVAHLAASRGKACYN